MCLQHVTQRWAEKRNQVLGNRRETLVKKIEQHSLAASLQVADFFGGEKFSGGRYSSRQRRG